MIETALLKRCVSNLLEEGLGLGGFLIKSLISYKRFFKSSCGFLMSLHNLNICIPTIVSIIDPTLPFFCLSIERMFF